MLAMDLLGILTVGNSFFASCSYTSPPRCSREERTSFFLSFMTPLLGLFFFSFVFFGTIFYQTLEQWFNVRLLLSPRQFRRELSHFREIFLKDVDSSLLLSEVLPSRKVDSKVPRSLSDRVENLMLTLRADCTEFLSCGLLRSLRSTYGAREIE